MNIHLLLLYHHQSHTTLLTTTIATNPTVRPQAMIHHREIQVHNSLSQNESQSNPRWCRETVSQVIRFDSEFDETSGYALLDDEDVKTFENTIVEMEALLLAEDSTEAEGTAEKPSLLVQQVIEGGQIDGGESLMEIRFWYTVGYPEWFVEQMSDEDHLSTLETSLSASGIDLSIRGIDPPIYHPASKSRSDGCLNDESDGNKTVDVTTRDYNMSKTENTPTTMQDMSTVSRVLIALASVLVVIGMTMIGLILLIRQERRRGEYDRRRSVDSIDGTVSIKKIYPNADTGIPIEQETRASIN